MELRGTHGIVTGASRGLGRLLAVALAERGVDLALAARSTDDLQSTVEQVRAKGVRAIAVQCDVTARDDLRNLVEAATAEFGSVELLVNNAGLESVNHFEELSLDDIERVMVTNSVAPMWLTRLVAPHMMERKRGHIVNVSSTAGKIGMPYFSAYASSKHALVGFSWCLREELKPHGIGVSVVCPSFISDTGMTHEWKLRKRPALAQEVSPEKVVRAVLKAIEKDKAESVVAAGLGPIADVFFALSPDTASTVLRKTGVHKYFSAEADARSKH
jgi:uncharacterized protein